MGQAEERSAGTAAEDGPQVAHGGRWRWLRIAGVAAVLVLFAVELVLGWSSLASALRQLRTPHVGWLALAVLAEVAAMSAYAHMQGRLLSSAGVRARHIDNVKLTYAAHSLNETLPGGAAFSTRLNYQQMRRFGASPAVASWTIALSGILSACALAVVTVGSALAAGGGADWSHLAGLFVATILLILGARHVARRPQTAESLIRPPLAAVNRLRHRPATHGQDRIRDFLQQLRAARLRPAHGAAAAILAVLNWLLDALCLWLCFRAVGEHPAGPTAVLLAFCAAMAAGTITIVPGGLGIIDSALILGLLAGGVTTPAAVATVVLYRIISFGFIIGLGWLSWLTIRQSTRRAPALPSPALSTAMAIDPRGGVGLERGAPVALITGSRPRLTDAEVGMEVMMGLDLGTPTAEVGHGGAAKADPRVANQALVRQLAGSPKANAAKETASVPPGRRRGNDATAKATLGKGTGEAEGFVLPLPFP